MAVDSSQLLRRALRANAIFSLLSGLFMLIADGLVAALLGFFTATGAVQFVGLNLVVFAIFLFWLVRRDELTAGLAMGVVAADLAWVVASWAAMLTGAVTGQGLWAVALVADIVLLFAIVQYLGVRRMRSAAAAA